MRTDGKAAKNKRIKKDALMSTAFDLFSSNGVNHTTISDITERAGLGKGTFYSYFKDKYDIRNHIIAHKSAQIFLKAKQAIEAQPEIRSMEDKIIGMSDNIIDQTVQKQIQRHIAQTVHPHPDHLRIIGKPGKQCFSRCH